MKIVTDIKNKLPLQIYLVYIVEMKFAWFFCQIQQNDVIAPYILLELE